MIDVAVVQQIMRDAKSKYPDVRFFAYPGCDGDIDLIMFGRCVSGGDIEWKCCRYEDELRRFVDIGFENRSYGMFFAPVSGWHGHFCNHKVGVVA